MPIIAPERQIHASLQIARPNGQSWVELTDYLSSAEIELGDVAGIGTGQTGVDGVARRMSFRLRNDRVAGALFWADSDFVPGDRFLPDDGLVDDASTNGEWLARLLNAQPRRQGDSFSPRDRWSAWNYWDGQLAPLLWPNREVVLRVAVTDIGATPTEADWITLFHGFLGDAIRTDGPTVECEARDLAKRLMDTYIMEQRQYGSEEGVPAEVVIQQILDDHLGPGQVTLYFPSGTELDPRPEIAPMWFDYGFVSGDRYLPDDDVVDDAGEDWLTRLLGQEPDVQDESPGFMITPYTVEYMSVWDAIQQIATQIGWYIGYRWHKPTGRMQLVLMEPPRHKDAESADFILTWTDDIYVHDLEITDRDVRNVITVIYRDAETDGRRSVTVQDDESIHLYGSRAMQIEEGDTSLIDTEEEAMRLAQAALSDLKDMRATSRLELPLLPDLDVFAGIVVHDPRVSSTEDFYAVESVRHELNFESGRFRTEAICSGRVVGGHHRWLDMQTRPGVAAPIRGVELKPNDIPGDRLAESSVTTSHIARRALSSLEVIQVFDDTGVSTTDYESYVDIPGFAHTFTLDSEAVAVIIMRISGFLYDNTEPLDEPRRLKGLYYLNLNGARVRGQALEAAHVVGKPDVPGYHRSFWASAVVTHTTALSPGTHTVKGQFKVDDTVQNTVVFAYHRELSVIIFKKAEVNIM